MILIGEFFANGLKGLPGSARVWVYQAPRSLTREETKEAMEEIRQFLEKWNTHGTPLSADAGIVLNQFLIFVADEDKVKASGCSIDQSAGLVRRISENCDADFFDRQTVAYMENGEVRSFPLSGISAMLSSGRIKPDTIVFNNLVNRLDQMGSEWMVPLHNSWHMQFTDQRA